MQIVIDIPKEVKQAFDNAKNEDLSGSYYDYNSLIGKAIKNGIPLPQKHGRLFDEKDIVNGNYEIIGNTIYELEPIVGADIENKREEKEPKYCDRNICMLNEYRGVECDKCEVMAERNDYIYTGY